MTAIMFVKIRAHAGEEERVGAGMKALIDLVRAEDGCLQFDVHRDLADPAVFTIYERWRDLASHAVHQQSDHFRDIAQGEVMDHADTEVLELADLL
jgi:quinol monooxygenase YgiN